MVGMKIIKEPKINSSTKDSRKNCLFCGTANRCAIIRTDLGGFFKPVKHYSQCSCSVCGAEWEFEKASEEGDDYLSIDVGRIIENAGRAPSCGKSEVSGISEKSESSLLREQNGILKEIINKLTKITE